MTRIVYEPNRPKIIYSLLVGMGLLAYAAYRAGVHAELYLAVSFLLLIIFVPRTLQLLFRRVALTIDNEGITDYTRPLGLIPWDNIRGAAMKKVWMTQTLQLDLHDNEPVMKRLPFINRALMSIGFVSDDSPGIAISFVACDANAILEMINSHAVSDKAVQDLIKNQQGIKLPLRSHELAKAKSIRSFQNPAMILLSVGLVAVMLVYAPTIFRDADFKAKIGWALMYVLGIPYILYSSLSYELVDGDFIVSKLFWWELHKYDIRTTVRIFKHGYDHLLDYGLQDYLKYDTIIGTWTLEGKEGDKKWVCNIGRFNTNVLPVLEYVIKRCPNKIDIDGDVWAKLKGIRW